MPISDKELWELYRQSSFSPDDSPDIDEHIDGDIDEGIDEDCGDNADAAFVAELTCTWRIALQAAIGSSNKPWQWLCQR